MSPLPGLRFNWGCNPFPTATAVGHRITPLPGLAQQVVTVSVLLTAGSCERRYAESPRLEQHLPSLPTHAPGDQSVAQCPHRRVGDEDIALTAARPSWSGISFLRYAALVGFPESRPIKNTA